MNINKIAFALTSLILSINIAKAADGSVSIYGLIDTGITFINNQSNFNNYKLDTGVLQANRWGLKGKEQLTNDISAIFNFESGFTADTGAFPSDNKIFGRQAWVGLEFKNIGSVSLGRQVDFMDYLGINYAISGNQYATTMTYKQIHKKDRIGGERLDNSIKFQSQNFNGLTAGFLLSLGEKANDKSDNRALSAIIGYDGISNLNTNIAYTKINKGLGKQEILAGALNYDLGFGKVNLLASNNKDTSALLDDKNTTYEIGYLHKITPKLSAGFGYQYYDEKTNTKTADNINNFTAALDYAFSKRTDAYFTTILSKGKGNAKPNLTGIVGEESSSNKQMAVRLGLRHKF